MGKLDIICAMRCLLGLFVFDIILFLCLAAEENRAHKFDTDLLRRIALAIMAACNTLGFSMVIVMVSILEAVK